MTTTAAISAIGAELQSSVSVRLPVEDQGSKAPAPSAEPSGHDLRLVIEEDEASKSFVYKTIDARTGSVVQQFPREEVLRLRNASGYEPGAVINARG